MSYLVELRCPVQDPESCDDKGLCRFSMGIRPSGRVPCGRCGQMAKVVAVHDQRWHGRGFTYSPGGRTYG